MVTLLVLLFGNGHTSWGPIHATGDVTRVSVVPRKVTVRIGNAEIWWQGCRDKNRLKKQNILFV